MDEVKGGLQEARDETGIRGEKLTFGGRKA